MTAAVNIRRFRWDDADQITVLFNTVNGIVGTEKEFSQRLMRQTLAHPSCMPEVNCFVAESSEGQLVGPSPAEEFCRTIATRASAGR